MCELMGMSFARPVAADFSLRKFGSRDDGNPDGWGLAWYPDKSVAVIKEPVKWRASQFTGFLENYQHLRSPIYIAHVREKSTGAEPTHADTHPFARELAGRDWAFCHNGTLEGDFWKLPLGRYRPVGLTDSEFFFCHLLEEIAGLPRHLDTEESWHQLHAKLVEVNRWGKINCLLSDGQRLFCYHDAREWKGLKYTAVSIRDEQTRHFEDLDLTVDLAGEPINFGIVVATAPLSQSPWTAFQPGELLVLEAGQLRYSSHRGLEVKG